MAPAPKERALAWRTSLTIGRSCLIASERTFERLNVKSRCIASTTARPTSASGMLIVKRPEVAATLARWLNIRRAYVRSWSKLTKLSGKFNEILISF
jgi:hypothetical protein